MIGLLFSFPLGCKLCPWLQVVLSAGIKGVHHHHPAETGFLSVCSFGACLGIRSVHQAGLELTKIHLPLLSATTAWLQYWLLMRL